MGLSRVNLLLVDIIISFFRVSLSFAIFAHRFRVIGLDIGPLISAPEGQACNRDGAVQLCADGSADNRISDCGICHKKHPFNLLY